MFTPNKDYNYQIYYHNIIYHSLFFLMYVNKSGSVLYNFKCHYNMIHHYLSTIFLYHFKVENI